MKNILETIKSHNEKRKKTKLKLWDISDDSFYKLKSEKTRNFIKISVTIALILLILAATLILIEYIRGDHPVYSSERSGAICNDGWVSNSTGRGTCSHHGGVKRWTYYQVGYHYCNPQPYLIMLIIPFLFLTFSTLFSKAFKNRLMASIFELLDLMIYIFYFVIILLLIFLALFLISQVFSLLSALTDFIENIF